MLSIRLQRPHQSHYREGLCLAMANNVERRRLRQHEIEGISSTSRRDSSSLRNGGDPGSDHDLPRIARIAAMGENDQRAGAITGDENLSQAIHVAGCVRLAGMGTKICARLLRPLRILTRRDPMAK